jgi:hypothetical protein
MTIRLTAVLTLFLIVTCDVQAQSSNDERFEFSSTYSVAGGEHWEINVDRAGNFSVKHYEEEQGSLKNDGNFQLMEEEVAEVWDVIQVDKFKTIDLSDKPQGNCDTQYIMTLRGDMDEHRVSVDVSKAPRYKDLMAIVVKLTKLTEKYTGLTPRIIRLW